MLHRKSVTPASMAGVVLIDLWIFSKRGLKAVSDWRTHLDGQLQA